MLQNKPALIVTVMKNEGPYVLEWVAHHMALGFDSFIVVTNDCDDQTDRILDRLEALIPLKHVPNPKSLFNDRSNWHVMAHRYASLFTLYKDAGWIYFTDVDEFLQIWVEDGSLDAFFDTAGGFDVVSFTSMPFGSSGVEDICDTPIVSQFTVQSKDYSTAKSGATPLSNAIKTMFSNEVSFSVRRNHRPRRADFSTTGHRWINGSGIPFSSDWVDGKAKAIDPIGSTDYAQFNHYAIRSADAFLNKVARGDAVDATRLNIKNRVTYWTNYDGRGTPDTRAARPSPKAAALLAEFRADPILEDLHQQALSKHRKRAAAARADPALASLVEAMGQTR